MQSNPRDYSAYLEEPGLLELLVEVFTSQDFWIGVAVTICVVGIALLLFGNRVERK